MRNRKEAKSPQRTVRVAARIPIDLKDFMVKHGEENERNFSRELVFLLRKVVPGEGKTE
jgi:hypothetical protein